MKRKNNLIRNIFIGPVIIYATLLIALPIIYVLVISFYKNDSYGGFVRTFTLENYISIFDSVYIGIFLKSFLIAIITTFRIIYFLFGKCLYLKRIRSFRKSIYCI